MKPGQFGPSKVAIMFKNYPVGNDQSECQFESGSLPRLILAGVEEELRHAGHCCQMRFSLLLSCRFFPCVRKQKSPLTTRDGRNEVKLITDGPEGFSVGVNFA